MVKISLKSIKKSVDKRLAVNCEHGFVNCVHPAGVIEKTVHACCLKVNVITQNIQFQYLNFNVIRYLQ